MNSYVILVHNVTLDGVEVEAQVKVTGTYKPPIAATMWQPGEDAFFDDLRFEPLNFDVHHLDFVLDEIQEDKNLPIDYYASDILLEKGIEIEPVWNQDPNES